MTEVAAHWVCRQGPLGVTYVTLPAFESLAGGRARLAISTRLGGVSEGPFASLNLGLSTGDEAARVEENRTLFCQAAGVSPRATVGMLQVHGARVVPVDRSSGGSALAATDALVTTTPGLALRVLAADCVPIALCDPLAGAVAAVHAGWRGTLAGVLPAAVTALCALTGGAPGGLVVALGPCIGPCHYEVGRDVADPFTAAFGPEEAQTPVLQHRDGRIYLDLSAALRAQLARCGVPPERIVEAGLCTACRTDLFYSHRAERVTGRFGLLAWLDS